MSDDMTSQYADHMMETLKHWQAHLAGGTVTDYCYRECLASDAIGFQGQIEHVLTLMDDTQRESVADALGLDGWAELSMMLGGPALDIELWEDLEWSDVADAIEKVTEDTDTPILLESGGVYAFPKCELLDEDGKFTPDVFSLEAMKPAECDSAEPDDLHLKVTLAWGGPNSYLFRDWGEDRLEVYWGDKQVWYGEAITDVLDYFAKLAAC